MNQHSDQSHKRPPLLSALCILTFIGSTTAFFAYFLASLFYKEVSEMILTYSSWHSTEQISSLYFTIQMVFYALSLIGAIRMWKLHRKGLWIYLFAQVLILFLPVIWINWQAFSTVNAIFTALFAGGYLWHYKVLSASKHK